VRVQGDLTINNPDTGEPFDATNMVFNWPNIFFTHSDYVGLLFGLTIGIGAYFARYGKWRSGSSLLLHLALGWFIVFLLCPVLLGIRVTPPRNDNWAGGLGVFLGLLLYTWRNGLLSVAGGIHHLRYDRRTGYRVHSMPEAAADCARKSPSSGRPA
jgi:hypothetical protein